MLKEAAGRGLLGSAAVIVVTAHPEPEGAEDLEIIRVVYTPTLVRRAPGPPVWVIGDPTASPLLPGLLRHVSE